MRFFIHKLGCPKNDVDADYIAGHLIEAGHCPVDDPEAADAIIVNTCTFIQDAKEESIEAILRMSQLKTAEAPRVLYVSGCLSQRYGTELLADLPEIDGAFGLGELDAIAEAMANGHRKTEPILTEPQHLTYLAGATRAIGDQLPYAYLKISDGCNRLCSFCSIPSIRGNFRSRPIDDILAEARYLAENGKRELILVSQEATLYGHDLKPKASLVRLLRELDRVDSVAWIRVLYLHPAQTTDELISYMADGSNKTLSYFDLPLQHINSEILKAMQRPSDTDQIMSLLDRVRARSPEAVLRSTFIVGFPGETDAQFEQLLDFIAEQEFDRAGAFVFSPEEGTPAAEMPGQVSQEVKYDRLDRLMSLQQEIALAKNSSLIGSVQQVMLDCFGKDGDAVGRTRGDCPEIDQEVYFRGQGQAVGDICRVRIEATDDYDLRGSLIGD